jgi:hypothetical protein
MIPMSEIKQLTCPVCQQLTFMPFFELNEVPVQDGVLWNSKEEALHAPVGDINLAFCQHCGYIGNLKFEPEKIRYDQEYSFSLHFSPTYQEFIHGLVDRLVNQYQLSQKAILEIGCGQGDFLRAICQAGENTGIGIDPSIRTSLLQSNAGHISFIRDLYSNQHAQIASDFICCRQMLDQIAHPREFIELVRRNIGDRSNTVVYFEVPNARIIFEALQIRNVIYEKSSWYTSLSLGNLFELCGFEVLAVEPCYEAGQYLGIEAKPSNEKFRQTQMKDSDTRSIQVFSQSIADFSDSHRQKISDWRQKLASILQAGKKLTAWGAGSGAINFFSMLGITDQVQFVVDINPKRQGKYLPITGQEVVAPVFLQANPPDVLLITNATYEKEIRQQVRDLSIDCDYWVI